MNIVLTRVPNAEIIHYSSPGLLVSSIANQITCVSDGIARTFVIPQTDWRRWCLPFRLLRRALRLDKCNVVPVFSGKKLSALVVVRHGRVFHIDFNTGDQTETLRFRQCRNVLHQSICTTSSGALFMGEYGPGDASKPVPVYRSTDAGRSWQTVYEFPSGSIRHVHGCYWDPFESRVWICTGDFEGENKMVLADEAFETVEILGDGSQTWRTCYPFFLKEDVVWAMDSPLETCHICRMRRKDRQVERLQDLPGPVWYAKDLTDGVYVVATANEIGQGVKDEYSHIYISRDAIHWEPIFKVRHDGYPKRYFKFGVIGFADGPQSSQEFYLFAEALKRMDGKAFRCSLTIQEQACETIS